MLRTPDVRAEHCKVFAISSAAPGGEVSMRVQLETFVGNIAIPAAVALIGLLIVLWTYLLIQL